MESPLSGAANGLAAAAVQKWFAAMGLVGLIVFATSLLIEVPGDVITVRCIALIMMGWGFGQAECRTFQQRFSGAYKITAPAWRLTVSGAILFAIAIGAAIRLAVHLFG